MSESFLDERCGLSGKVAAIFGGAGGLGRACALDLAAAGVALTVVDRDQAAIDELESILADTPAPLRTVALDVRETDRHAEVFERIDAELGGLDILVNVVGGTFPQPFEESAAKGWDALIRTNFTWLLEATSQAIPRLRRRGGGSIVNLTSIEAHRAAPGHAVYSALKGAVAQLSRSLAVELGPDQIRVNCVAPDLVPTPNMERAMPASLRGDSARTALNDRISIPLARRGAPDDIGGCVLFLASDLSRYVTGSVLHPDGGVSASRGWFNWPDTGWRQSPPDAVLDHYEGES
jgi:3-oxoacyl-[acyl-carrier protein] reductase